MSAERCDDLRLTGSSGANRVMEAEFKRLVMRSPFHLVVEKPKRESGETLLYPFDVRTAWVAACYHRTSSRITWDLCSSDAVRLEPLFADLAPLRSFILPGGSAAAAWLHLARTVCRRAERIMVELNDKSAEGVSPAAIKYVNRLSDFLFVAGRFMNDKGATDVLWVPGQNR